MNAPTNPYELKPDSKGCASWVSLREGDSWAWCKRKLDCLPKPPLSSYLARICRFRDLRVGSWHGGDLGCQSAQPVDPAFIHDVDIYFAPVLLIYSSRWCSRRPGGPGEVGKNYTHLVGSISERITQPERQMIDRALSLHVGGNAPDVRTYGRVNRTFGNPGGAISA